MTEKQVYEFYEERLKVLYCEIEARNNELPVELLFEIHSAFDHLKRFHLNGECEDVSASKAYSHLKRGTLDAYKLKLKYFNRDCDKLLQDNPELRLIDSGTFLPRMLHDKAIITKTAKDARLIESKKDESDAFDKWDEASHLIDKFESNYFDPEKLSWAKKQGYFQFRSNFVIGIITGVIASGLFAVLCKIFTYII